MSKPTCPKCPDCGESLGISSFIPNGDGIRLYFRKCEECGWVSSEAYTLELMIENSEVLVETEAKLAAANKRNEELEEELQSYESVIKNVRAHSILAYQISDIALAQKGLTNEPKPVE